MIVYPAKFKRDKDGISVTFPGVPEAITCGHSEAQAVEYAVDALETIFSAYMKQRRDIPQPRPCVKGMRPIALPTLTEAKIRLYEAMRQAGVRKADLARRMGWQKSQVDRLLDLRHRSRLDQIEGALAKLHKRLAMHVEDVPRALRAGV
jgi:antitoxin HicB